MNEYFACILTCLLFQKTQPEPPSFPTFEPFVASRMFKVFGDVKAADLEKFSKQLSIMGKANTEAKDVGERYAPPKVSSLSALLEPEVPDSQRFLAPLIPLVMMKLEPLWTASSWNSDQVASARAAVEILKGIPDAPKPVFAEGKDGDNRAGLEGLAHWFKGKVSLAEWYAAMIFTMDDGPYAGLPYEAQSPLPAHSSQMLDERTELRLCLSERPREPWVLQAVREGKPLWSRVLSAAPDESVSEVSFMEDPVQRVGPYGWKVRLLVNWSGGKELSEVFLDPKANLLFYFLSW